MTSRISTLSNKFFIDETEKYFRRTSEKSNIIQKHSCGRTEELLSQRFNTSLIIGFYVTVNHLCKQFRDLTIIIHDFCMTFRDICYFHDFPGLEYSLTKFHDCR